MVSSQRIATIPRNLFPAEPCKSWLWAAGLQTLQEVAEDAGAIERSFWDDKKKAGNLTFIAAAMDAGNVSLEDIRGLLVERAVQEDAVLRPITIALRLHVDTSRWFVAPEKRHGVVTVTDGQHNGVTPVEAEPHWSWFCPNCGSAGPWDGNICRTCNRMSDPFD